MRLTEGQINALRWGLTEQTERILVWTGGGRAGKTTGCALYLAASSVQLDPHPDRFFLIAGKTEDTARRNLVAKFGSVARQHEVPIRPPNKHEKDLGLRNTDLVINGHPTIIAGANDVAAQDRIQGMTIVRAVADEAMLMPKNFLMQLVVRLSLDESRMIVNLNKQAPSAWIKQEWIDTGIAAQLDSHTSENHAISQNTIDFYDRSLTGHYRERMLANEWTSETGLVVPRLNLVAQTPPGPPSAVVVGVDFGISNPTAAIWVGRWPAGWFAFDEYAAGADLGQTLTVAAHARNVVRRLPDSDFVLDPSAAALRIEMLNLKIGQRGQNTPRVHTGRKEPRYAFACINAATERGKLFVVESACPGLVAEQQSVEWDILAANRGEDKATHGGHRQDGFRYAVAHVLPLQQESLFARKDPNI